MLRLFSRRIATKPTRSPRPLEYDEIMQSRSRWLFQNDTQLAVRHLEFDVDALAKVAAKAGGGSRAEELEELGEGSYNKVYRFGIDNGNDVVARIPFRNAGPRGLLTRSEVATMDFLRFHFGALIPKVLSWEATSDNAVGCEYILMEKCTSQTLESADRASSQTLLDLAKFQNDLASIRFSSFGSIFYKEDVDPILRERPLYAETMPQDACSDTFRIGPCVDRTFYRAERRHLDLDRGPWINISSYIKAVADCEIKWIEAYYDSPAAKGQLGTCRSAAAHVKRLQQWVALAPTILPSPDLCAPTLSHPDLHPGNIFVDGQGLTSLSSIIDWQGATVRPFFETCLTEFHSVQEVIDGDGMSPSDSYAAVINKRYPKLQSLSATHLESLRTIIYASSYCWYLGLAPFEERLLSLASDYGALWPAGVPDPAFALSEADLKDLERSKTYVEAHNLIERYVRQNLLKQGIRVGPDGSVSAVQYEDALKEAKKISDNENLSKRTAEGLRKMWPFRESRSVITMESCAD